MFEPLGGEVDTNPRFSGIVKCFFEDVLCSCPKSYFVPGPIKFKHDLSERLEISK